VVDDEPTVRELLPAALRYAGFSVATAATGQAALSAAYENPPDLVVLDVMLPDMDGFEVLRRLRRLPRRTAGGRTAGGRTAHIPVLFLTAADTTEDMLNGLRLGGDDYVTKPFDLQVLTARIEAILRRTGGGPGSLLVIGDVELDPEGHSVTRAGRPVRLSPTEFRLLHFLMFNAGHVVSKAQILDDVWRYDFGGDPSIVDTYISYLRRKLDTVEPKLIHTIHGVGYVLRKPKT
jgi:two-component system OmpR family response regulator